MNSNSAKASLPVIIIAGVEILVGIFLIADPVRFTFALVRIVGIALLILGFVFLIRFLLGTRNNSDVVDQNGKSVTANPGTLIVAIIALVIGVILSFATAWVMGLFGIAAILFGIFLVIAGILKIKNYVDREKAKLPSSPLTIVAAIISIVLGIIIVVNPFKTVDVVWLFAGIALIVSAVVDLISLFTGKKPAVKEDATDKPVN